MKKFSVLIIISILSVVSTIAQVTNDYRSISSGNWTTLGTWERYNGGTWATPTAGEGYPGQTVGNNQTISIRNSHTINIDNSSANCLNLIIESGGILEYPNTNRNFSVSNNLTINTGGTLRTNLACTSSRTHNLYIDGNLTVDGTFDGYALNGANEGRLYLTFNGATNNTLSGTGSFEVYELTIDKGTDMNNILDITMPITINPASGSNSQNLNINNGTFKLSSASSITAYNGNRTLCTVTARVWLNNPGASLNWNAAGSGTVLGELYIDAGTIDVPTTFTMDGDLTFSSYLKNGTINVGTNLDLEQLFTISSGTLNVGALLYIDGNDAGDYGNIVLNGGTINVGDGNDYIQQTGNTGDQGSGGDFTINGGTVNIYGGLEVQDGTGTEICTFTMTGGNVNIDPQYTTDYSNSADIFIIGNNSEVFFTGGTMTFVDPHASKSSSARDAIDIAGITGTKNFIGSTIKFGDGVSSSSGDATNPGYSIETTGTVVFGTIILDNPAGSNRQFYGRTTTDIYVTDLIITNPNDLYFMNGRILDVSGDLTDNGVLDCSTSNSHLRFSGSVAQNFSGTGSISGTFTDFTVNNSSATGVTTGFDVLSNTVNLTDGIYYNPTNLLTVEGTASNDVTFSAGSYVTGQLKRAIPNNSSNSQYDFPVGKTSDNLIEMFNVNTSGAGKGYITAEAIVGATTGTGGTGIRNPLNADGLYWKIDNALNTVNLTSVSNVRMTKTIASPPPKVLGQSNNTHIGGTYNSIGGSYSAGVITSSSFDITGISPVGTAYIVAGEVDPLIGTYTVGATGNYLNLTAVAQALRDKVVDDNVIFEMLADYDANTETIPVDFDVLTVTNPSYDVTIRPKAGVAGTKTERSGAVNNEAIIFINGISKLKFDGRPGGVGASDWIFSNTKATNPGPVFEFKNDAIGNQLSYITMKSATQNNSYGVLYFGKTSNTIGNDDNTISYCNITGYGGTTPMNGIYSDGTAGAENSGNIISNNNIYDIFTNNQDSYAILINSNNTDWTISNNKIYQTTAKTFTANRQFYGISIESGTNYTIDANIIGYSSSTQTGFMDFSGSSGEFIGINFNGGTGTLSNITNNIIAGIKISSSSTNNTNGLFTGIWAANGDVNVGTAGNGNIIGTSGVFGTYPIEVTYTTNNGQVIPIYLSAARPNEVRDNNIGGIKLIGNFTQYFIGIQTNSTSGNANYIIDGNTIGSTTQTQSILVGDITDTGIQQVYGIWNYRCNSMTVSNNIISNFVSYTSSNSANTKFYGIYSEYGTNVISGNTVSNLYTYNRNTQVNELASVLGIVLNISNANNQEISNNIIFGLENLNATNSAYLVTGIYADNLNSSATNLISGNFIHSFDLVSNKGIQNGIFLESGTYTVTNNMVRLGVNSSGASITLPHFIVGINYDGSDLANFYNNSVYIGGTGVSSSTTNTYALFKRDINQSNIFNNILVNARSNAAGTASHIAYCLAYDEVINTDYNIFYAPGTGGVLANYDGTNFATLREMQTYTNYKDLHSGVGDPNFVNTTGNSSAVNLHVQSPTPAEGMGLAGYTPANDFDLETRSGLTPVDIGADAGNYVFNASVDIFTPTFTYTSIDPQSCGITDVTIDVTIQDQGTGVSNVAGSRPQIYYRDNSLAWATATIVEGSLQSGTTNNGVWRFNLTGLVDSKKYEYYFVSQDLGTILNLGFSKYSSTTPTHTNVLTPVLSPDATVNIDLFTVCVNPKATYHVGNFVDCPTCDFETLTAYGDFFFNMNAMTIDKNVTCYIDANTTENAMFPAEELFEDPVGSNFTVDIIPNDASLKTLSSDVTINKTEIRFEGADRYTIDGQFAGDGNRWLNFRHDKSDQSVFQFVNDAQNTTIKYLIIEGSPGLNPRGIIYIDTALVSGNDNLLIDNNYITDNTSIPQNSIYSKGNSTVPAASNSDNIISNNIISDFDQYCVWITATGNGDNWTISGNTMFNTVVSGTAQNAIRIESGAGHTISNNNIGGNAADNSGIWENTGASDFDGIYLDILNTSLSTVSGNTIKNILLSQTGWSGIAKIISCNNATWADITNNTIQNIDKRGRQNFYGIYYNTTEPTNITGNTLNGFNFIEREDMYGLYISNGDTDFNTIDNNTISGFTSSSNNGGNDIFGIYINNGIATVNNNNIGGSLVTDKMSNTGGNFTGIHFTGDDCENDINGNSITNVELTGNKIFKGIFLSDVQDNNPFNFQNNTVDNITLTNTGSSTIFYGYDIGDGRANFTNNICGTPAFGISNAGTGDSYGIYNHVNDNNSVIDNNTVSNISGKGDVFAIYTNTNTTHSVSSNIVSGVNISNNINFAGIKVDQGTISMLSNKVDDITLSGTTGSSILYGIWNTGANVTLNTNTIGSAGKSVYNNGTGNNIGLYLNGGTTSAQSNLVSYMSGKGNLYGIRSNTTNSTITSNSIQDFAIAENISAYGIASSSNSADIQGNTVQNISMTNTGGSTNFYGISITGGTASVGTTTPNTIGNPLIADNILCNGNEISGIRLSSTSAVSASNNIISNLTCNNFVEGIYTSGTGVATINLNTLTNIKTNGLQAGTLAKGIDIESNPANTITSNIISNIYSAGTLATNICGIYENGTSSIITKNKIYGIKNNSTSGSRTANGVILNKLNAGYIANNMISIGENDDTEYRGIWVASTDAGASKKIYFNSVYIGGTATGGNSYSFLRSNVNAPMNLKNNILSNFRTGSGNHYSIANLNTANWTNLTYANANNYYCSNPATVGLWGAAVKTFDEWTTQTGEYDTYLSTDKMPIFTDAINCDLHIDPANSCHLNSVGVAFGSVTTDFDGDARHATRPDIGADEFTPTGRSGPYVWRGWTSTDWDTDICWQCETAPGNNPVEDIIIPKTTNIATIKRTPPASTVITDNLIIRANAELIVNPDNSLTTDGDLTLDGTLRLKSISANGSCGSYIDNANIIQGASGNLTAERYVSGNQWHEITAPIKSTGGNTTSALFTRNHSSGNFNTNFYRYDETFDLDWYNGAGSNTTTPTGSLVADFKQDSLVAGWSKYHNGKAGADNVLAENIGYMYWSNENKIISFIGNPATGTYNATGLTLTQNDPITGESFPSGANGAFPQLYDGWNFLGNPYPSSLDWQDITDKGQLTNVDGAVYVWDNNQYSGYMNGISVMNGNLGRNIAPMQGFFVHVNNVAGGSVNINNTNRTHNAPSFLKGSEFKYDNLLKLQASANGFTEEIAVYFPKGATGGFDSNYDILRCYGSNKAVPSIYTLSEDSIQLALNGLSKDQLKGTGVPLGFKMSKTKGVTISIDDFIGFNDVHVYLEDRLKDTLINLRTAKSYTFDFETEEEQAGRFLIRFDTNRRPELAKSIEPAFVNEDSPLNLKISEKTFTDPDFGDAVSYRMESGKRYELPSWLSFNPKTMTLKGTPDNSNVGVYTFTLVASDMFGLENSKDFTLEVLNVNDAPILVNKIQDIKILANKSEIKTIPGNTFIDIDKFDVLKYSAQLEDGSLLPDWINFNPETFSFEIFSSKVDSVNVKITATDLSGESASDIFSISVKENSISDMNENSISDLRIYPNLTSGIVFIEIPQNNLKNVSYNILDVNGKILAKNEINDNITKLDISKYASGTYFVQIQTGSEKVNTKVIKE